MRAKVAVSAVLVAFALISVLVAAAQAEDAAQIQQVRRSSLVQNLDGGEIDWGRQMMYASADAPLQSVEAQPNRGRAYLSARDFAKMEAIARLLVLIEGTTVTYQGSGKELMDEDSSLRRTIEGYVKNVEISRTERILLDGAEAVRVTVGTPIYGASTPGTAFLDKLAGTEKPKQPPLIELPEEVSVRVSLSMNARAANAAWPASSRPVDPSIEALIQPSRGPYSSLIVDARGQAIAHAISPKIRKRSGDLVYGLLASKTDPAVRRGTVHYASSIGEARDCAVCGDNPLIIRATGRGGGNSMCDVMVSDEVASLIWAENRLSGFLDDNKVILVSDPPAAAPSPAPNPG